MEQVAELLVLLQQAGYIDYTHFKLECGCSEYSREELEKIIEMLKTALFTWDKKLSKQRKSYPELNYYTSQQLLDLQKEFGKLNNDPDLIPSEKLKLLLLSVTPLPTSEKIRISISHAMAKLKEAEVSKSSTKSEAKAISTIVSAPVTASTTISDLSDEQKDIFENLKDMDMKATVIMAAFDALGEDATENELMEWCFNNEHKYSAEDDDDLPDIATGDTDEEEDVAEDHPVVMELLEQEYPLKVAIEAVKKAKGDTQTAREYAARLDMGKEIVKQTSTNEWYNFL